MGEGLGSFEYHFEQHKASSTWSDFCGSATACSNWPVATKASIQQCMSWLDDPERRRLLVQEEEETGYRFSGRANWMGYGRWLSRRIKRPVATWKVNLLMLLSNAACVAATSWLLVPAMSHAYRPWLEGDISRQQTWRWLASLLLWVTVLWWGFSSLSPPQVTLKP